MRGSFAGCSGSDMMKDGNCGKEDSSYQRKRNFNEESAKRDTQKHRVGPLPHISQPRVVRAGSYFRHVVEHYSTGSGSAAPDLFANLDTLEESIQPWETVSLVAIDREHFKGVFLSE